MTQRREIVERHVLGRLHVEIFGQLTEQLGLLDAVDPQVRFQVGVELDHFRRIAGLLDHEVDQELLQLGRIEARWAAVARMRGGRRGLRGRGLPGRRSGGRRRRLRCSKRWRRGGRRRWLGSQRTLRRRCRPGSSSRDAASGNRRASCSRSAARRSTRQFAEQLRLLDAVDAQVRFQVGIQLDDFRRIAGLLDHEVDQELLQLGRIETRRAGGARAVRRAAEPELPGRRGRRGWCRRGRGERSGCGGRTAPSPNCR